MANWPNFFKRVRAMCDASPDGSADLTIEDILKGAQSSDKNVDKRWWWDMMMNPNAPSHQGVLENGMQCEPLPEGELVKRVVFRIKT